jgi:hypothetical protein
MCRYLSLICALNERDFLLKVNSMLLSCVSRYHFSRQKISETTHSLCLKVSPDVNALIVSGSSLLRDENSPSAS